MSDRDSPLWEVPVPEEVRDELDFHREMREREFRRLGLDPRQAREQAMSGFGDLDRLAAECRRIALQRDRKLRISRFFGELAHDLRLGVRQLRRRPIASLVTIAILALGIGAVTAVFSVLSAVLLAPLPLADADRLVMMTTRPVGSDARREIVSPSEIRAWAATGAFASLTPILGDGATLERGDSPRRVSTLQVGESFFDTTRLEVSLGRAFTPSDFAPGSETGVIVSRSFYETHLAADASMLGTDLILDGRRHRVVGVVDDRLDTLFDDIALLSPLRLSGSDWDVKASYLLALGRLADGTSLEQARVAVGAGNDQLNANRRLEDRTVAEPIRLRTSLVGDTSRILWLLLGAAFLVLLVACANAANLILVDGLERSRELGVRAALGAGSLRILRQLLSETSVLVASASLLGLGGAVIVVRAVVASSAKPGGPLDVVGINEAGLDPRVAGLAVALAALVTLTAGGLPAASVLRRAQGDLRSRVAGASRQRLRSALIACQIAVTVTLLLAAGLLIRSAIAETRSPLGFDPSQLLSAGVSLPSERYGDRARVVAAFDRLLEEVQALPGVDRVAAANRVALAGPTLGIEYHREDDATARQSGGFRLISPGFSEVIGTPILEGRSLTAEDRADAPKAVLVNRTFARLLFGDDSPVGKTLLSDNAAFRTAGGSPLRLEIVGVVADSLDYGARAGVRPEVYMSLRQAPSGPWSWISNTLMLLVRTEDDPEALTDSLRRRVAEVDPQLPLFNVASMSRRLVRSRESSRFQAALFSTLGVLALALALGGVYAATRFFVSHLEYEVGVRLALGATSREVARRVMAKALIPVAAGIALGAATGVLFAQLLESQLYRTSPFDPATAFGALALMATAAWLASAAPARRCAKVDPARVLHNE